LSHRLSKCDGCSVRTPRFADVLIGAANGGPKILPNRYSRLEQFMEMPAEERMNYWRRELARCTKCYACRQACPLCYCRRCISDKNRPVCIETSATLQGNFAWHVTRAFHLAGRCVGCEACVQACPAGIDLNLLNQSLARAAEKHFGHRAGDDPQGEPLVGSYDKQDGGTFIR
jgi:ferredoxin